MSPLKTVIPHTGMITDSDIPHHHSRAGQIHPFTQRRLFSEKLVELRIEIAHGRRMAAFGFCRQKVVKTQKPTGLFQSRRATQPVYIVFFLRARQKKSCRTSYMTVYEGSYSFCSPVFNRCYVIKYGFWAVDASVLGGGFRNSLVAYVIFFNY